MDVVWLVAGLVLMAAVILDVWLTVLHPDAEGLLAKAIRRAVWRAATVTGSRFPAARRHLLVLAGPVLVAATFVAWVTSLIFGFTLVVWSAIEEYAADPQLRELTFVDALYFAGNTVAVLGYGDISPLSSSGKLFAVAAAAAGFVLLSGITAYLIEVVSGLSARDRFTLAVHDDTRDQGGTAMVADCLVEEGAAELRQRCRTWAEHLRAVDETVHRYPLVVLTYRSRRREYDLEPALCHAAEVTAALLLLVADRNAERGLRTTAEGLALALLRLQRTIADQYLPAETRRRLAGPAPGPVDQRAVDRLAAQLAARLGGDPPGVEVGVGAAQRAAEVVCATRIFLDGLRHWARSEPYRLEWDD